MSLHCVSYILIRSVMRLFTFRLQTLRFSSLLHPLLFPGMIIDHSKIGFSYAKFLLRLGAKFGPRDRGFINSLKSAMMRNGHVPPPELDEFFILPDQ